MLPSTTIQSNYRKKRWLIYWVCVMASMVTTVLEVVFYNHKDWDAYFYVLSSLAVIVGVSAWCFYDCRVRNGKLSQAMRGAIAFLGPLGVSAYYIESRGFRGALKLGFGLFLYVPFYALYFPTWSATAWILQASGFYN